MRESLLVGIGYSEVNDVSMYNDKFEYTLITKKQYDKLDKQLKL